MQRNRLSVALMLTLVCASFVFVPPIAVVRAAATTYVVNTAEDPFPPDNICLPKGGNPGQSTDGCTLREAITLANSLVTTDTVRIEFNIPRGDANPLLNTQVGYAVDFPYGAIIKLETWTITLQRALPFITHSGTFIDGFSQEDNTSGTSNPFNGPVVVIDGIGLTSNTSGLTLLSDNDIVSGLTIVNFSKGSPGIGIDVQGSNNVMQGNYLGIDKSGLTSAANRVGVRLTGNGIKNNTIGGDVTVGGLAQRIQRNIISGNDEDGVRIEFGLNSGNRIQGNYVGIDLFSSMSVPNKSNGIYVYASSGNQVGSIATNTNANNGNIVSGNKLNGILIQDSSNNTIQGNIVGLDATSSTAIPNGLDGVRIESAAGSASGNSVGAPPNDLTRLNITRNILSGNTVAGLRITGDLAKDNKVYNNYIGLSGGGVKVAGVYTQTGVIIEEGADRNQIGGGAGGQPNFISGNMGNGVLIAGLKSGPVTLRSDDNAVVGNTIGETPAGNPLKNTGAGVVVTAYASRTKIGGAGTLEGNVMINHPLAGIVISGTNTISTTILGNAVGVRGIPGNPNRRNDTCLILAPNESDGIQVLNGPQQTQIGGPTAASGNLIGGNLGNGIFVTNALTTTIQSNQIGTSQDKDRFFLCGNGKSGIVITNSLINTITNTLVMNHANGDGISITGSNNNLLVGNRVFKNGKDGIKLNTALSNTISNTMVLTNTQNGIWLDSSNTSMLVNNRVNSNSQHGVRVGGGSKNTTILGSTIFTNTLNGISVESPGTQRVKMLDNRISANKQLGIELNPKTLEPTGDPNNPNHDINPPFAVQVDQTGRLTGRVLVDRTNSSTLAAACITCTIQLFSTAGDGQGRDKLTDFKEVSANGYFTITLGRVPSQLALTATDGYSNTSEFAVFNASYALAIGPAYTRTAVPGQTISYTHRITNTGTVGFTDLKLGAVSSLKWSASVLPPAPITLAAGESKPVTLTLTLPTGAAPNVIAGSVDQTRVTVSSTAVTTATASVTDTTTVLPKFSLSVTPGQALSVRPGLQAVYVHRLTNTGNLPGSVTLSAVTDRGGAWTTTLSPASVTLAPGASIDVDLRVTVPSGSVAGIKAITTLTVNVTSPTGITVPPIVDTTTVAETKQATIIPNREGQAAAGQTISFPHTVTNIGNTRVTYILTGTSSLGSVVKFRSDTPNIKLNADGSFTFEAPSDPNQNTNVFNFFIDITLDKRTLSGQIDLVTITLLDEDEQPIGGASVQDTVRSVRSQLFVRSYLPLVAR